MPPPIHQTTVSPPEQSPALSTSESTATTILETPPAERPPTVDGFPVGAQQRTTHGADVKEGMYGRRASWGAEKDEDLARKARDSGRRRSSSEAWVDGDGRVPPSFTFPSAPVRPVSPPIIQTPASPPATQPAASPPFSFGTFRINSPTAMLGTPTTELGAFEYPLDALSPTIRRLVADSQPDSHSLVPPGFTPGLRRTSSTSTVPVSPSAGRRPSVVHSNTVPQADAGRRLSLILGSDGLGLGPHSASAVVAAEEQQHQGEEQTPTRRASDSVERRASGSAASPFSAGRPSILGFAHQVHPSGPIPPSLAHLGPSLRRGSIPSFPQGSPMPARDRQSSVSSTSSLRGSFSSAGRGSFSGPVITGQGTRDEHVTVSTAYLYQRRASLASTSRGLLSSNPPPTRPGMTPTQRQGSVSSKTSDHSTGSRESTTTLRDFRTSFPGDARPAYERHGSSNESTATERNRRMSLPSPGLGESSTTSWEPQRQGTNGASDVAINPGFSFGMPQGARPFKLGTLPSARTLADSAPHQGSSGGGGGGGSPKDPDAGRRTFSPTLISSTSSSEELSDTTSDTPDTNPSDDHAPTTHGTPSGRRGFRLSQRGIEARERRRSSRMSAVGSAASNTLLQTIPSDYVVDFTAAGSARSSLSSGRGARIGEERIGEGIPVSAPEDEDVPGKASAEPVETSFRAFAFPPRSGSVGSIK